MLQKKILPVLLKHCVQSCQILQKQARWQQRSLVVVAIGWGEQKAHDHTCEADIGYAGGDRLFCASLQSGSGINTTVSSC